MALLRIGAGRAFAFALLIVTTSARDALAQDVTGAGSTFVAPVMASWAEYYATDARVRIDYQAVGSGSGIQMIEAGKVDFGATDKPLEPAELGKYGLCQFPIVIGGIVPVMNLPGISSGQIRFSGRLLADIFMGRVNRWDDPEVAADNPYLALPSLPITVVFRSDGSGTTYNLSSFLSQSNIEWKHRFGVALSLNLPTGAARKGNGGIAAAVKQTTGAIGYVEYAYALRNYLTYGSVSNAFRNYIIPTSDSFRIAASSVNWQQYQDFSALMTNAPGPAAYPLAATTFILMPRTPKKAARGAAALAFFRWALEHGGTQAAELEYVALPADLVAQVENYWASHISVLPDRKRLVRSR